MTCLTGAEPTLPPRGGEPALDIVVIDALSEISLLVGVSGLLIEAKLGLRDTCRLALVGAAVLGEEGCTSPFVIRIVRGCFCRPEAEDCENAVAGVVG